MRSRAGPLEILIKDTPAYGDLEGEADRWEDKDMEEHMKTGKKQSTYSPRPRSYFTSLVRSQVGDRMPRFIDIIYGDEDDDEYEHEGACFSFDCCSNDFDSLI